MLDIADLDTTSDWAILKTGFDILNLIIHDIA